MGLPFEYLLEGHPVIKTKHASALQLTTLYDILRFSCYFSYLSSQGKHKLALKGIKHSNAYFRASDLHTERINVQENVIVHLSTPWKEVPLQLHFINTIHWLNGFVNGHLVFVIF